MKKNYKIYAIAIVCFLVLTISSAFAAEQPQASSQQTQQNTQYLIDPAEQQFYETFGDIKEKVKPRPIDKKANEIAKKYADGDKTTPMPTQGRNGSVQYTFGTTIPRILCRPLRVTDIELEPGERITNAPFLGDSVNWAVLPSASGTGNQMTYHIIIKPAMPDIVTNLVVHTDRRTYQFDLVSTKEMYTPHITFAYPADNNAAWDEFFSQLGVDPRVTLVQREKEAYGTPFRKISQNQEPIRDIRPQHGQAVLPSVEGTLNFNYKIVPAGKNIEWIPTRVYDDGLKTYIEFPGVLDSVEAPIFMLVNAGQREMVNYRLVEKTFVIDRLIDRGVLLAGTGKFAKKVTIIKIKSQDKDKTSSDTPSAPILTSNNESKEKKPFTFADWRKEQAEKKRQNEAAKQQ